MKRDEAKLFNMWPKPRFGKVLIKVKEYEDGAEYMEMDKYLARGVVSPKAKRGDGK